MKVTDITVTAGRTFNHPFEDFSNLRPQVTLHATLDDDEDHEAATKILQRQAERLVEDHKTALIATLRHIRELASTEREVADLERRIADATKDLERARDYLSQQRPGAETIPLGDPTDQPAASDGDDEIEF